ncbi:MAG: hypothetical protein AAF744_05160 [Pseudomonadota bacterium]
MPLNPVTVQKAPEDMAILAHIHRCPVCKTEITAQRVHHPGHCGQPACARQIAVAAAQAQEAQKKAAYRKEAHALREACAPEITALANACAAAPDDIAVAVVPHRESPLVPLPRATREAYLDHLSTIVEEAFAQDLPLEGRDTTAQAQEPHPWHGAGCRACEGRCCAQGGGDAHAFQTVALIQHLRHAHPTLGPDDMKAHFEAALPVAHNAKACVFQGACGCTLERAWRADICNAFACFELRRIADHFDPAHQSAVAIFSRGQGSTRRFASYIANETSGEEA